MSHETGRPNLRALRPTADRPAKALVLGELFPSAFGDSQRGDEDRREVAYEGTRFRNAFETGLYRPLGPIDFSTSTVPPERVPPLTRMRMLLYIFSTWTCAPAIWR